MTTSSFPTIPLHHKDHHKRTPSSRLLLLTILSTIAIVSVLLTPSPSPSPPPLLFLISFDGFRFGYQHKTPSLPNLSRLISNGTSASLGLIPVFPTLTFPNHYSLATGLLPVHHGIISNSFSLPSLPFPFSTHNHSPLFYLGQPIWETLTNANVSSAVYFWPGGEVIHNTSSWSCPSRYCPKYNSSVPFESRVDTVLSYFDTSPSPSFVALYFEDPDSQGHRYGPDHPEITAAVSHMDSILGRLIHGLESRGLFRDANIILVGDHGMVGVCEERYVYLEDLAPWIEIPEEWVDGQYQLLAVRPPKDVSARDVVERMNLGLGSGRVKNGDKLRVYLKEELPARLHYSESDRICPVIGLVEEGYIVMVKREEGVKCGGAHGYDNELFSMRSIFVGHGPRFEKGRIVPSFLNVEVYNLITEIMGVKGAPNNGSNGFANSVLLPKK